MKPGKNHTPFAQYTVLFLAVLAPLLGGSVRFWAQAALALATGMLFLIAPPKTSLGLVPNLAFSIVLLVSSCAFLPATWFPAPEWRVKLTQVGAVLPGTVSPQPWLTLELILLLLLELSWAYYLFATACAMPARQASWTIFGAGMTAVAAMLTVSFQLNRQVPFWPNVEYFGFFPNRNHTSNVLGLSGIIVYALALHSLDQHRRHWWMWIVALSLICSALVLNYSRAGIILVCGGIVAVHACWFWMSHDRRRPLLASGLIALLIGLLILSGGKTAARFGRETAEFLDLTQNARFGIQRDALVLSSKAPLMGAGLGNFSPIFTMYAHDSIPGKIAAHPESDWLWATVELGWIAPIVIAILFVWWARNCFPFDPGTFRLMRTAAFVAGCGFALHAFFDVPGHQVGALWPALFISSTALNPNMRRPDRRAIPFAFRIVGLLLILTGSLWWASFGSFTTLPSRAALDQLKERMRDARDRENYPTALEAATAALRIAPLDWSIYQARGAVALVVPIKSEALRDFAVARLLLPYWPDLRLKQGLLLAQAEDYDRAFELWRETLKLFPDQAPELYGEIYQWIKDVPDLLDRFRELGRENTQCLLFFFRYARAVDFALELQRLFFDDPQLQSFTPTQLKTLFELWYQRGEKLTLAETLQAHVEWEKIAWRELARVYADNQDYRQAYETLIHHIDVALPEISPNESIDEVAARFRISGGNEKDGLLLARAQAERGQVDDALAILTVLSTRRQTSPLVEYVEAQLWAKKQNWAKAWQAMWRYVEEAKR